MLFEYQRGGGFSGKRPWLSGEGVGASRSSVLMSMFRKNQTPTGLVLRVVSRCDLPGSVTALCPVEKEGVLAELGPARLSQRPPLPPGTPGDRCAEPAEAEAPIPA